MHTTTRRNFLQLVPVAATLASAGEANAAASDSSTNVLWYREPAAKWEEALPIANGRLGAMMFGGVETEHLQLNENTVWAGRLEPDANRPDAWRALPEIRELIRAGNYEEVDKAMTAHMTCQTGGWFGKGSYGTYQTLGDIRLEFPAPAGHVEGYRRWLDIGQAVAGVTYEMDGAVWTRELFSSAPAQVLAMRIACTKRGAVTFTARLSRAKWAETRAEANDTLIMTGTSTGQPGDLRYEAQLRILVKGGSVAASNGALRVSEAGEAVLLLAAGANYALDYANSYKGADPHAAVTRSLTDAAARSYDSLKSAHIRDYQRLFGRVSLDLGNTPNSSLPTGERLLRFSAGEDDPRLVALFYQYGRYLLISSSGPENALPANSQGLWGDGLSMPWGCDYKSNINFQMNYWPAETANLGECHTPMLRLIQSVVEPGRKTAKAYFDAPGWMMAYTTNAWGWTAPGPAGPYGPFFCGGAWICQHLWEHYAFTRDRRYLAGVYPVLKEACEAFLHVLVEDDTGHLVTSPATSPENRFRTDDGHIGWACAGTAVETGILWELFNNTAMAAHILALDEPFRHKLEAARDQLRLPHVGRAGQLMEWSGDWDMNAPELHHRHISHLFPLHPGRQISPWRTAALADACRKSLEIRGDESTGWSKAWKINCWARLHDGDHAWRLVREQLKAVDTTNTNYGRGGGTYPNLLDAHPPFQIDGNFGAVSGINEMLLQSHLLYEDSSGPFEDRYVIQLLPALPAAWPQGHIRGLRARGGMEVSIEWRNGRAAAVELRAVADCTCRLLAPAGQRIAEVRARQRPIRIAPRDDGSVEVQLRKGAAYEVVFA